MLHHGHRAFVEVSDDEGKTWKQSEEYKTEYTENTATCYIEACTGQRFRLVYRGPPSRSSALSIDSFYDGHRGRAFTIRKKKASCRAYFEGVKQNPYTLLPFIFGPLRTTNDDTLAGNDTSQDLGQLRLEVWRSQVIKTTRADSSQKRIKVCSSTCIPKFKLIYKGLQQDSDVLYSEQAVKKRSANIVALGKEQKIRPSHKRNSRYLDPTPIVVFRFKYLCEALLDLNKIRPLPASESSADDMARPSTTTVQDSTDAALPNVKLERGVVKANHKRASIGEIIDLSYDDESSELEKLREEVARLRKKVKLEKPDKATSGTIIDLSED